MFIGLSAYQISLVSAQVQSAYKGLEATVLKAVRNPAYDPLNASKGREWLAPTASSLQNRPMLSVLDISELKTAARYWTKHWYMTLVTDGALAVMVYLLLSTLKKTSLTDVDVSGICSVDLTLVLISPLRSGLPS